MNDPIVIYGLLTGIPLTAVFLYLRFTGRL